MSRILVTGGAGFVGSWVASALVARGDDVMIVDDCSGGDNRVEGVRFMRRNLAIDNLAFISEFAPEIVFHAAANAREIGSLFQPAAVCAANVMATSRTMEAAILGKKLVRTVFTSSMSRYGDQPAPFGETTHAPAPNDVYAANKVCCEQMIRTLADVFGFAWSIAIPHNCLGGPGAGGAGGQSLKDKFRNVCGINLNKYLRGEPIIVFGDGEQVRAFSAIEDATPCFVRQIDGAADGLCVNVGGEIPVSINTLVSAIKEDVGAPDYPVRNLPPRPKETKVAHCTVALSKAVLGYEEKVGWRESVRRMCAWAKTVGPQEWTTDVLPLDAPCKPEVWR